nr:hypothetical protein [Myxococcota bacterium]
TLFRFFRAQVFALFPPIVGFDNDSQRRDMEAFMLQFPSDLAPIVGQQVTDDGSGIGDVTTRISDMKLNAVAAFDSKFLGGSVTECDLIVKGTIGGEPRGFLYDGANYDSDRAAEVNVTQATLDGYAAAAGQSLTYTCAPPGSGVRMALDRDLDGALDSDERDANTDPANPGSITGACNDGVDNDGDGDIDLADAACTSAGLHNESPECDDGVDNDHDALVDLADPDCADSADDRERKNSSSCGLGGEVAFLLIPWMTWRLRRRRSL